MPLASEAAAPTYSWLQRSSQLTEFALLKDAVKRLERAAREQLLLENESQGAFDTLAGEIGNLKEALAALSRVRAPHSALMLPAHNTLSHLHRTARRPFSLGHELL